jgi:hypothetical protein
MQISGDPSTCGVYHIVGFGSPEGKTYRAHSTETCTLEEKLKECMEHIRRTAFGSSYGCKMMSCCLTDAQLVSTRWPEILAANGFRLVTRFRNTSRSWNNIFHYVPEEQHEDRKIPEWWKGKY